MSGKCIFIAVHYNVCIVEPPNKGHSVPNNFLSCGELVPILEVKSDIYREVISMISQTVPYQRFHCVQILQVMVQPCP